MEGCVSILPEEARDCSGAEDTGGYELPDVDAGDRT